MNDTLRHLGLRRRLVKELIKKGIKDNLVLKAIESIPRHLFIDATFEAHAYIDKAFPIDENQTISQPYTVAFQTELLSVKKRDRILEIGTGSGYQSAILAHMGASVYTLERHEQLFNKSRVLFDKLKLNRIKSYYRDGNLGLEEYAPFDKIIITASIESIPEKLMNQIKPGGCIVAPLGDQNAQIMTRINLDKNKQCNREEFGKFNFVPMLKGKNHWKKI